MEEVDIFSGSRLVVSQIDRSFEAKDQCMSQYLKLIESLCANFCEINVIKVPRSQNSHADSFATLASSSDDFIPRMMLVESLKR